MFRSCSVLRFPASPHSCPPNRDRFIYIWDESGDYVCDRGRFNVTRGQTLLFNDARSRRILAFSAIPLPSYNAEHIQQGLARLCLDPAFGLPRVGFHLERSLWKATAIGEAVDWTALALKFQQEKGISIAHAQTPRAKGIEAIGGRLQSIMEAAPCYVGRNERLDTYEREQAFLSSLKRIDQPRKEPVDPAELMMSWEQFLSELERAISVYNAEPQQGEAMAGRSPDEVWAEEFGARPLQALPESLHYLLCTSSSVQTVQGGTGEKAGVRSPGGHIWYSDSERLGMLIGEKVRVRYNPETPDFVMVCHLASDPKERAPFRVGRGPELPAIGATAEDFKRARASQKRFLSHGRTEFRAFAPPRSLTIRRENLGPADLRATGAAIAAETAEHRAETQERKRHGREIAKRAASQGLTLDGKSRNPERQRQLLDKLAEVSRRAEEDEAARTGTLKPFTL